MQATQIKGVLEIGEVLKRRERKKEKGIVTMELPKLWKKNDMSITILQYFYNKS